MNPAEVKDCVGILLTKYNEKTNVAIARRSKLHTDTIRNLRRHPEKATKPTLNKLATGVAVKLDFEKDGIKMSNA